MRGATARGVRRLCRLAACPAIASLAAIAPAGTAHAVQRQIPPV